MTETAKYRLDGDCGRRSAEGQVFLLRQGHGVNFQMNSDEFMREHLDDVDYAFWRKKKEECERDEAMLRGL